MSEEAGIQCGKCLRKLRRNDSYCPFCAGERMRLDTPEARKLEQVARVCHAAIKAFSETMGDHLPDWHHLDADAKMYRISGVKWRIENLQMSPRQIHDKWRAKMIEDGWVYGPKTSTSKKIHNCLVDFDELSPEQQIKDRLFSSIIEALTLPQQIEIKMEDVIGLLEKLKGITREDAQPDDESN